MSETVGILMGLIRYEIKGDAFPAEFRAGVSDNVLKSLYSLSKKHDLAHLIGSALKKNNLLPTSGAIKDRFYNETVTSVYRYEQLNYEFHRICETFENAKIPFMPLKGSVLRDCYPEPWMRTSCDIDVLIREDDVKKASAELVEKLSYLRGKKGSHDIPFETPTHMHVELHYDLIEGSVNVKSGNVIKRAWEYAFSETDSVRYKMKDEMFYTYHVAHMAKHFVNGGCGIRPFIDLWLLNHRVSYDKGAREKLLEESGLIEFERAAVRLSEVWFSDAESDEFIDKIEDFILSGGVYGNIENHVAMKQQKKGGKFRYIMSRIFMPYSSLKYAYPVLEKHKWLLPFMEVRRWLSRLFTGRFKRSVREMKINSSISAEQQAENAEMLNKLGL